MVKKEDVVKLILTKEQMDLCLHHARQCSLGGKSEVRQKEERQNYLSDDQIVGQVCTCGATIWLLGDAGVEKYNLTRAEQNLHPGVGDGGDDIPPFRIDVKGSMVRNINKDILSYNLLVRPLERHKNGIYVLALSIPPKVVLIGWEFNNNLPEKVESEGIFKGAYRKIAKDLKPMIELKKHLNIG